MWDLKQVILHKNLKRPIEAERAKDFEQYEIENMESQIMSLYDVDDELLPDISFINYSRKIWESTI